ncbi:hypothetical protein B0J12DRAFT_760148, partial [Macrophomina phaseolina]
CLRAAYTKPWAAWPITRSSPSLLATLSSITCGTPAAFSARCLLLPLLPSMERPLHFHLLNFTNAPLHHDVRTDPQTLSSSGSWLRSKPRERAGASTGPLPTARTKPRGSCRHSCQNSNLASLRKKRVGRFSPKNTSRLWCGRWKTMYGRSPFSRSRILTRR